MHSRSLLAFILGANLVGCSDTYNRYETTNHYGLVEDTGTIDTDAETVDSDVPAETDVADTDSVDTDTTETDIDVEACQFVLSDPSALETVGGAYLTASGADEIWVGASQAITFNMVMGAECGSVFISHPYIEMVFPPNNSLQSTLVAGSYSTATLQGYPEVDGDVSVENPNSWGTMVDANGDPISMSTSWFWGTDIPVIELAADERAEFSVVYEDLPSILPSNSPIIFRVYITAEDVVSGALSFGKETYVVNRME